MKIDFWKHFAVVIFFFLAAEAYAIAAPEDFDPSVTDSLKDVQIGLGKDLSLNAGELRSALNDVAKVSSDEGRGLNGAGTDLEQLKKDLGGLSKELEVGDTVNSLKSETDSLKKGKRRFNQRAWKRQI